MDIRKCPVCGNDQWVNIYESKHGKIMTGDQRICSGELSKICCTQCGVVANSSSFNESDLLQLYGKEYELNTLGAEEHYFYTDKGREPRSKVFFDWIQPHLVNGFSNFLEIGCGEGNLLQRFSEYYPNSECLGIDGSVKATELARRKGLNVQNKLIFGGESIPASDVIILVNVLEHVEDIESFILTLKRALNTNGQIVFTLPIQDYGGYDVFFKEHVWHFTSSHINTLLKKNGLKITYSDVDHKVNHGIGLFVCEIETSQVRVDDSESYDSMTIKNNFEYWLSVFSNLENKLKEISNKKVVLFGAGEVATLFLAFSQLDTSLIVACIDDTKPVGFIKHGIPVYNSEWLENNHVDIALLTINKKYNQIVKDKLAHLDLDIISVM